MFFSGFSRDVPWDSAAYRGVPWALLGCPVGRLTEPRDIPWCARALHENKRDPTVSHEIPWDPCGVGRHGLLVGARGYSEPHRIIFEYPDGSR